MDIVEQVKRSGVVGAGGAGFPAWKKLSARAEYVIANGSECEPLIRVDQQLMTRYACERGGDAAGDGGDRGEEGSSP